MPAENVPRDACAPTLQEKLDRISKACPETKGEVLGPTLNRIMMGNVSPRSRRGQLLALLARVEAAVTPHAPCKSGCAAYCHIPLSISMSVRPRPWVSWLAVPRKGCHAGPLQLRLRPENSS